MPGIVKNYYKNEKEEFDCYQELKFLSLTRLCKLQELQLNNIANMMYESIIDKNVIFNTIQEMIITNRVLYNKSLKITKR